MTGIFEFFRSPITFRRRSSGSYVNGRWVEGSTTDSTITASIQPLEAEDMQELPEGRRESVGYAMFTATQLLTVQEAGSDQNADLIVLNGDEYEVHKVEKWQNNSNFGIVNHYKFLILRINDG